jgi:type II secretory pathway pseudopilin PulG
VIRVIESIHSSSKAFTIIEAMIAILLLGIMMAGGIAYFTLATKHASENAHEKIALELAQSKMEDVRSSTPSSGWTDVTIGYLPGNMIMKWDSSSRTYDVGVVWHEPDDDSAQDRSVNLITYISN